MSNFLRSKDFKVIELEDNQTFVIDQNFEIKIHRSDFYDSALVINLNGKKIFNLNDCPIIKWFKKFKKFMKLRFSLTNLVIHGKVVENLKWRQTAAKEKLNIYKQSNIRKLNIYSIC